MDVGAYNRVLKLRTSPKDGWMQQTVELQDIGTVDVARPDWEVPLIIGGVVLAIVLAAALAAMLIEKECHQTLLRVRRGLVFFRFLGFVAFPTSQQRGTTTHADGKAAAAGITSPPELANKSSHSARRQ